MRRSGYGSFDESLIGQFPIGVGAAKIEVIPTAKVFDFGIVRGDFVGGLILILLKVQKSIYLMVGTRRVIGYRVCNCGMS